MAFDLHAYLKELTEDELESLLAMVGQAELEDIAAQIIDPALADEVNYEAMAVAIENSLADFPF